MFSPLTPRFTRSQVKTKGIGLTSTLTPEQETEYEKLREEAGVKSANERLELGKHVRSLESARAKAASLTAELKEVSGRREDAAKATKELKERMDGLNSNISGASTELKQAEKDLAAVEKHARTSTEKRDKIDNEIESVEAQLREARDDKRRSKEEEKLNAAIEALKRHYPGVQGKLVDLCRPTQRRFNMAVTVAAGKNMDAIVVDTKATGFECIQYLREQR